MPEPKIPSTSTGVGSPNRDRHERQRITLGPQALTRGVDTPHCLLCGGTGRPATVAMDWHWSAWGMATYTVGAMLLIHMLLVEWRERRVFIWVEGTGNPPNTFWRLFPVDMVSYAIPGVLLMVWILLRRVLRPPVRMAITACAVCRHQQERRTATHSLMVLALAYTGVLAAQAVITIGKLSPNAWAYLPTRAAPVLGVAMAVFLFLVGLRFLYRGIGPALVVVAGPVHQPTVEMGAASARAFRTAYHPERMDTPMGRLARLPVTVREVAWVVTVFATVAVLLLAPAYLVRHMEAERDASAELTRKPTR